jgi:hypothetical protein
MITSSHRPSRLALARKSHTHAGSVSHISRREISGLGFVLCAVLLLGLSTLSRAATPAQATPRPAPPARATVDPHSVTNCVRCHDAATVSAFNRLKKAWGDGTAPGWDRVRDAVPLSESQRLDLHQRCQGCHPREFTGWAQSAHALTYADSFLNRQHNRREPPINDCLRCHAMFFSGDIQSLVAPLNSQGPWHLVQAGLAKRPSLTCLACHQIHPDQWPIVTATHPPTFHLTTNAITNKAGFFDRREGRFFTLAQLPQPRIRNGDAPLEVAADPRQRVCYQCHAPGAAHQAGSSDDRTLRGVHGGLSCLDCHDTHALEARNACGQCHPAVSHCGLEVTRMDTTYRAAGSPHDIHTVACRDCHPAGPPAKKLR